jgi:hypothetical protein
MATVDGSTVEVGDLLRDRADNYEGTVEAVDETVVILRMASIAGAPGEVRVRGQEDLYYNAWDAKGVDNPVIGVLVPTDMTPGA